MDSVLTILLAGGKGARLGPLTRDRAKPAVPFAGMYRIVDFALSNCINSRLFNVLVLTQYKSLSLEHHITQGWSRFFHPEFGQWLTVAAPQQRVSEDWYQGTADAVYQNLYSIELSCAGAVLVLAADHVYKMDYRRILAAHKEHGGSVTVATLEVPVAEAVGQYGVVEEDALGRVTGFQEKPARPTPLPGGREMCLASMGIYVFSTRFLVDELRRNAGQVDPGQDFGHHILPRLIGRESVRAFRFSGGGTGAAGYWRDVGTVDAYYRASMDLLADPPGLDLYDRAWPVYSFQPSTPPARVAVVPEPAGSPAGPTRNNIFANGTLSAGWVRGSVVGFDCRVAAGAAVEDSVLFDRVSVGPRAEVRRAVLDKGARVLPDARIGFEADADRARGFVVSEGGVTCVPKDTVVAARA